MTDVIQTTMAAAFDKAVHNTRFSKEKLSPTARFVVRQVLTNSAKGVGVKWRPRKKTLATPMPTYGVEQHKAETAVSNVGEAA